MSYRTNSNADAHWVLRTLRFAAVGSAATILYLSIAYLGVYLGGEAIQIHVVAYLVSVLASYIGQKFYTFGIVDQNRKYGARFILANLALMMTQLALVIALDLYSPLNGYAVLTFSALYFPAASFLIHTFWTFRAPKTVSA